MVIVTDPMCSWCWGMSNDIDQARQAADSEVTFDLMLGGINTTGTLPMGEYGRRYLKRLWAEVSATTGQHFGELVADNYIHNSRLPCLALEAIRLQSGNPPFDFLRTLQNSFFTQQQNINDRQTLLRLATQSGYDAVRLGKLMDSVEVNARLDFQFENSGAFGTGALPSVLIEVNQKMRLLAGGYVDDSMLRQLITQALRGPMPG
ncbi:MAG: DsbA family protein [bacterium]